MMMPFSFAWGPGLCNVIRLHFYFVQIKSFLLQSLLLFRSIFCLAFFIIIFPKVHEFIFGLEINNSVQLTLMVEQHNFQTVENNSAHLYY